ncbi:MAG: HAMP domain-containing protein [Planctomycetaceae bacterium]|nr:HAMP domain-containing protein [Planctomycetaceae bacterium]
MSIRTRLLATCAVLVAFTAIVGILGSRALGHANRAFELAVEEDFPAITALLQADSSMQQAMVAQRNLMFMSYSSPAAEEARTVHTGRMDAVDQLWAEFLRRTGEQTDPAFQAAIATFETAWREWRTIGEEVVSILAEDSAAARRDAIDVSVASGTPKFEAAREALKALVDQRSAVAQVHVDEQLASGAVARQRAYATILVAVLLALALAFWMASSICRPLARAAEVFRAMAGGDFSHRLGIARRDEIGSMSSSLDAMATRLDTMSQAAHRIAEGDLQVEVQPASKDDRFGHAFVRMIGSLQGMADCADRIACGDLSVQATPQSERDRLGHAFERMLAFLRNVARSADHIAEGDLDVEVQRQSPDDQLGLAFENMLASLRSMAEGARAIARGELDRCVEPRSDRDQVGHAFSSMTHSLAAMAQAAERIASGELDVDVKLASERDRLGLAFQNMVDGLRRMGMAADHIARGDLSVDVRPRSENDKLGHAFARMVTSLETMAGAAERIAAGDLDVEVRAQGPKDRLGRAFEHMTASLQSVVAAAVSIADGNLGVHHEPQSDRDQLGHAFQRMVNSLREFANAAESIAAGDLSVELPVRGDSDQLGRSFARMVANLSALVVQIRASTSSVSSATDRIQAGNADLEMRTSEQSRTLEVAQQAIHVVAEAARDSADRCRSASQLVRACQAIAEQGRSMMDTCAEAMEVIGASSQQISKSVRVINSHADQTHLLALNARIEAARAGEHGRGFEVVASEVGDLARDSGLAARGITELVEASDKRTADGVASLRETREIFTRITSSVGELTELVVNIARAVEEQAAETGELQARLQELEALNAENAALTVRTAEGGRELGSEVKDLNAVLGSFRLRPDAQAHVETSGERRPAAALPGRRAAALARSATH